VDDGEAFWLDNKSVENTLQPHNVVPLGDGVMPAYGGDFIDDHRIGDQGGGAKQWRTAVHARVGAVRP